MKKYRYVYELNDRNKLIPVTDTSNCNNRELFTGNTLFLDIETTGFQRTSTFLTIIGLAWQEDDRIVIEQWLNDTGQQEEPLLLLELEGFMKGFHGALPKLIHYNGTTFDLPYLKAKYEQYHLPTSLSNCESLDLYHLSKKYRTLLSLDGLKQKNLEECFGLFREDTLSGQELINVYLNGIRNKDQQLLDAYLLHNKEDMEGMVFLQNLLRIDQLFEGNFEISKWLAQADNHCTLIQLTGDFYFYKQICISSDQIQVTFENHSVWIRIPICHVEARFFHENYKDYYYLPAEDCAMHKSVAEYVEKEYRIKATKETCYTKKRGDFLPLPLPSSSRLRKNIVKDCCILSLFYLCYGDCTAYVSKDISEEGKQKLYLKYLLQSFI